MEFSSVGSSRMSCTCNNCLFMSASNISNMVIDIDKFYFNLIPSRCAMGELRRRFICYFSTIVNKKLKACPEKCEEINIKKFSSFPSSSFSSPRSLFEWKIDCDSVKRFFPWFSSRDEIKKFPAVSSTVAQISINSP